MTSLPRNGQFFQRRKMFVEAPFHNMKSYVPLDWSTEEGTTQELQRIKIKQSQEHESLRKVYNQQVDKRLQRRYVGYLQDLSKSRDEDVLSREVEHFNHSKLNSGEAQRAKQETQRVKRETREMGLQYQPLQVKEKELESKGKPNSNSQTFQPLQKEANYRPSKDNPPHHEYHNSNPQNDERDRYASSNLKRYEQNYPFRPPQQNNSFVQDRDRYRSLEVQRSPYPRQNLSKLVEQLYTGTKVQQYPFRNVIPDKLENHLRQKTKADRKRAYEVTLNLFKH